MTSCDKPRQGANTRRSADFRMGQPNGSDTVIRPSRRQTRGTETSQYPEEKKTKVMAQVAASERAPAQTSGVTAPRGVEGVSTTTARAVRGITWKGKPQRVKAPYLKTALRTRDHLSSAGHEKSCVNPRGPSRKAKYYRETDSEPVP